MLKACENIDPGTQEYGTSIDLPGTTKSIANTPMGETGPRPVSKIRRGPRSQTPDQKPESMRKTDFGVRSAMDNNYVQGFMDKCAAAGVDPELLVKQAIPGMGALKSMAGLISPMLGMLNPMNMFRGARGLFRGVKSQGKLRDLTVKSVMGNTGYAPSVLGDIKGITRGVNAELANPASRWGYARQAINKNMLQQGKRLAGGALGTAGLGTLGYESMKPEPQPPTMQERLAQLLQQYRR